MASNIVDGATLERLNGVLVMSSDENEHRHCRWPDLSMTSHPVPSGATGDPN